MSDDGEVLLQELLNNEFDKNEAGVNRAQPPPPLFVGPDEPEREQPQDKETHTQWALGGNGKFVPVGSTIERLPAGVYETFATPGMWGLEASTIVTDGIYDLPDMATAIVLDEVKKFWESKDKYKKHNLLYKRGILTWGPPGCLEANTRISYSTKGPDGKKRSGKGGSIERLYQAFHRISAPGKGRYQKAPVDSTFWVSSVDDEGKVFRNQVLNVVKSGKKEGFKLTTQKGLTITASADHKFRSNGQFVMLKDLKVGDPVEVHPNNILNISPRKSKVERNHIYVKNHPVARTKVVNGQYTYKVLPKARALIEAEMNGLGLEEYKAHLNSGQLEGLSFLPKNQDVHHIDENCLNDVLTNLHVIDHAEHARQHGLAFVDLLYFTTTDSIQVIEPVGPVETYDIQMEGPYNNFVANKFVVHNSGKTIAIKLLIQALINKGGIVIIAQSIPLLILCLKAIRRIEPERNLIVVLEDIDEIINFNGESVVLSMLDGESSVENILCIASTNFPERLGSRIINRPSRFDRRVFIGMPSQDARRSYLEQATNNGLTKEQLSQWVIDSKEMSIAHLRELVAAVYCLDQPYDEVIKRLQDMATQVRSADEFTKQKMGFKAMTATQALGASAPW